MIHIQTTSEDESYSSNTKDVLLVVKHTIKRSEIIELLQAYKNEKGQGALEELLASIDCPVKPVSAKPFMCFVEGGRAPSQEHRNALAAVTEAKRLAIKTNSNVMVLQRHYTVEPAVSVNVREP